MTGDESPIIFFDGVCNLCNRSVQIVIKNDKKKIFKFSSLQSDFAKQFFTENNYLVKSDSIILFDQQGFHEKSAAALKIATKLRFPFPLMVIGWIFPAFIRNGVYASIAKNRYKWFGRTDSCMIPSAETRSRFLL